MHPIPTRIALASSVLVLGSVGTVSAVNLQSSPVPLGRGAGTPQALAPLGTTPQLPAPPAVADPAPTTVSPDMPARASRPRTDVDRVLGARDLVDLAKAPLGGRLVAVPVDDVVKPVRKAVKRVALKRPTQVVDRTVGRYQARKPRQIGNKFGNKFGDRFEGTFGDRFEREVARDMASRYAGELGRRAVEQHYSGVSRDRVEHRAAAGWAKEYVGRHRAE